MLYGCYVKITLGNDYVIESKPYTTHVTGIPYSVAMQNYSNDAGSGWTSYNCAYETNCINLLPSKNNNGRIVSPKLPCPEDCNIAYTVAAKYYRGAGTSSNYPNATVYVGASPNTSTAVKTNGHTINSTQATAADGYTTVSGVVTMSASNQYISISHNNPKRYDAWVVGYLGVRNITINYDL